MAEDNNELDLLESGSDELQPADLDNNMDESEHVHHHHNHHHD